MSAALERSAPVASLPPAEAVEIGSYALLGKIARGGMGTVFVARRAGMAGFKRLFAMKIMHDHLADSDEFVQMFLDEARLASRLHHPNVVPIVDVGEIDGRQFVVMDYIEGCSLGQLLKLSPDARPIPAIVSIFTGFLDGLHAAHELCDDHGKPLNLVHRDVSPENVLIGTDGIARVTDFGIAKAEARLTSTRPGLRKGKLAFMAPEQLLDQEIDRRADVFSAGAVLWTALTGVPLFLGGNDAATMRNLVQQEIPLPSSVGLRPPPWLDAVCLKALGRDPETRYTSAAEMAEALRSASLKARSLGSATDVATWLDQVAGPRLAERRRTLDTSSSSAVYSLAGSEGSAQLFSAAPHEEKPARHRLGQLLLIAVSLLVFVAVFFAVVLFRRGPAVPSAEPSRGAEAGTTVDAHASPGLHPTAGELPEASPVEDLRPLVFEPGLSTGATTAASNDAVHSPPRSQMRGESQAGFRTSSSVPGVSQSASERRRTWRVHRAAPALAARPPVAGAMGGGQPRSDDARASERGAPLATESARSASESPSDIESLRDIESNPYAIGR